jgi:hypothetical protein
MQLVIILFQQQFRSHLEKLELLLKPILFQLLQLVLIEKIPHLEVIQFVLIYLVQILKHLLID